MEVLLTTKPAVVEMVVLGVVEQHNIQAVEDPLVLVHPAKVTMEEQVLHQVTITTEVVEVHLPQVQTVQLQQQEMAETVNHLI